jgi:predicted RNA-binding Zn-ribbon protein involved in translation (DUF1610 family)
MTRIRALCPACGEVEFNINLIVVVSNTKYRFECPSCGGETDRDATEQIINLLLSAGVKRKTDLTDLSDMPLTLAMG